MEVINKYKIPQDQLDLIERFLVAYNAVDHHLREQLRKDPTTSFSDLLREYAARYPRWKDRESLRIIGDLRNAVIHQREKSYEYLSVPLPSVVEALEQIRDQLISPETVYPKFGKPVISFQFKDQIQKVLKTIYEKEYSQFPVYNDNIFQGLITENGITRWLASESFNGVTKIELHDVYVRDLFRKEEQRMNSKFIRRTTSVLDAENFFVQNSLLEALLITENGRPNEKILGIITRWDMISKNE
jgi:predicted transcriptional regulator